MEPRRELCGGVPCPGHLWLEAIVGWPTRCVQVVQNTMMSTRNDYCTYSTRVDFSLLGVQGKEITSPKLIVEVSLLETKTVLVTQSGVIPISTN